MAAYVELETDDLQGKQTQQKLVHTLKQLGATGIDEASNAAQLLTRLQDLVKAKPVLLVVDNVWTAGQLDGLLPTSFHTGSRLMLTSRASQLGESDAFKVKGRALRPG